MGDVAAWSDLNRDVLYLVMMRLRAVDCAAFGRVCKSWRSVALSNINKYIMSRPPMSISFSTDSKRCYLEDFEGRKFSTILPHSVGRTCIGVTCGYLILSGKNSHDFWLVNLITRHELHFPHVPDVFCRARFRDLRGILVFSPSISESIFVVLSLCDHEIWFSIAGRREWIKVSHHYSIKGLHAFNGKIFTLHTGTLEHGWFGPIFPSVQVRPCELRLYPDPTLDLLEAETFPEPAFKVPKFVSSGENLYVIDLDSKHPYMNIHKLDFGNMKWVSRENAGENYVFFRNKFNDIATITPGDVWADLSSQYRRYAMYKNGEGRMFNSNMWYVFYDFLDANLIHE